MRVAKKIGARRNTFFGPPYGGGVARVHLRAFDCYRLVSMPGVLIHYLRAYARMRVTLRRTLKFSAFEDLSLSSCARGLSEH